jgi:uncharacterized protein YmfQ (DUF2313 family)
MSGIPLTSNHGRAMLAYLPRYYETSRVMGSILQAQGTEIDKLGQALDETLAQFFVNTATWGLDTWEKELGLAGYAGKPDDQRRSRIISKLRGMGTTTVSLIKNVAESYVYSTVEVTSNTAQYGFAVKFIDTRGVPPNLDDLKAAIEEIKPAHLMVIYEFIYTSWGEVRNTTWATVKTGTWGDLKIRQ